MTKSEVLTAAKSARRQKAIIECKDFQNEWWVMHDDGRVEAFDTASHALKAVQKRASRGNKSVTITTVEWRNVPSGWTPPKGQI